MSKLLTPTDIHLKRFHTHRLVEGYDINEVDEFLEEVEHTVLALCAVLMRYEFGSENSDVILDSQTCHTPDNMPDSSR